MVLDAKEVIDAINEAEERSIKTIILDIFLSSKLFGRPFIRAAHFLFLFVTKGYYSIDS